jgi:sulfite exporter TauE/SafE
VALVSGILLILFGLKSYIPPINRFIEKVSLVISARMQKSRVNRSANLFLGVMNGLLPCGLSFSAAILSVNSGSYVSSALYMVLFGLGTLPVLLGISYLPKLGKADVVKQINRWIPTAMLVVGFLLVIRSAGLGIPYLSPEYNAETEKMECCEPVE